MRDAKTERLLTDVRLAVTAARAGGVSAEACLFDAAVAAVDVCPVGCPSAEARSVAAAASRCVRASAGVTTVVIEPEPSRLLAALRAVKRTARRVV